MKKRMSLVLVLVIALTAKVARSDFTFLDIEPLPEPINILDISSGAFTMTADGLEAYFTSVNRPGGYGREDIWRCRRQSKDDGWDSVVNLGPKVNTSACENSPCISADGLELYFGDLSPLGTPAWPDGYGDGDIWVTQRANRDDEWTVPVNLGQTINSSSMETYPNITADGLSLYFGRNGDLYIATRLTKDDNWGSPVQMAGEINTESWEGFPSISVDQRVLLFYSNRPGGHGGMDIYMAMRPTLSDIWGPAINLGPMINTPYFDISPSLSFDGCTLHFTRNNAIGWSGSFKIYRTTIHPVVDLNKDGIVDAADMCIIVDHWGENYPLCDIGPMPLGDGIVDVQDLIVLAEHLTTEVNDVAIPYGRIIYVDADATGANDGSSWTDAFKYLQDALADTNAADMPVEIRVAQGIYKPDQGANQIPGDRKATLRLIDGATLKGGFAGFGELDPNAWDVDLYETVLSGDLAGNDIEVENPEDLFREPTRLENSRHVLTLPSNILTATLDGFTVSGGNPHESGPFGEGGGLTTEGGLLGKLENANSKITVRHCTFSSNSAAFGGGVYIHGGSSTLVDCALSCNYHGMLINECNVTLINCKFIGNSGGLGIGGCSSMLTNCTFTDNSARGLGIALSNAILTNCTFTGNSATERGGGFQSTHESRSTLINCTFAGNSAAYGGGMYNRYGSTASLLNCTFVENSAQQGAGLYNDHCCDVYGFWSSASLTNCILWGGENEVYSEDESTLEVTYSDVNGGWPGVGNIDVDPLFADPNNGDYHLKSQAGRYDPKTQSQIQDNVTSPCIDAGDPNRRRHRGSK